MRNMDATLRGILAMLVSMACYVTNDSFMKLAMDDMPASEAIFIRALNSLVFFGTYTVLSGHFRNISRFFHRTILFLIIGETLATCCFMYALANMEIANATAILQILPLVITAVSAFLFREHVGWRRWCAVFTGFFGALLVIQPGTDGFNMWSLLVLVAVLAITLKDMSVIYVPSTLSGVSLAVISTLVILPVSAGLSLLDPWYTPSFSQWGLLLLATVFLVLGQVFTIVAMRNGDVSVVTPFRYSVIVWALVYGYLFWDELPNMLAMTGIVIICASGLFTFYREHVREPKPDDKPA